MPECDAVFEEDNYNEIYFLKGEDGVRKLGDAEGISIYKYGLSKFLGKYMRISAWWMIGRSQNLKRILLKFLTAILL